MPSRRAHLLVPDRVSTRWEMDNINGEMVLAGLTASVDLTVAAAGNSDGSAGVADGRECIGWAEWATGEWRADIADSAPEAAGWNTSRKIHACALSSD